LKINTSTLSVESGQPNGDGDGHQAAPVNFGSMVLVDGACYWMVLVTG
jgi:hypothetical protein